jgi:hypothetical protein
VEPSSDQFLYNVINPATNKQLVISLIKDFLLTFLLLIKETVPTTKNVICKYPAVAIANKLVNLMGEEGLTGRLIIFKPK